MQRDLRTIQYLATMPFLDRLELAAVSNAADRTMHDVVADLKDRDLVASFRHSTDLIASTRRLYVTRLGLRWLAEQEDEDVLDLMQRYPVSRHWQRILLERLDAVGVIYRLASHVAAVGGALRFKWYRSSPLDAGMFLPDGRAIGIVRQGSDFRQDGVLEEGVEAAGDGYRETRRPAGDRARRDADASLARAVQARSCSGASGTGEESRAGLLQPRDMAPNVLQHGD